MKRKGPAPPARSVMFIDNTTGGELARRMQEAETELGQVPGYRISMAESAGSALSVLLPSTNPWVQQIVAEMTVLYAVKVMKNE